MAGTSNPKLFTKLSSVAILRDPLSAPSEQRSSFTDTGNATSSPKTTVFDGSPHASVTVDISLRRGRIALATVVIVSVIFATVRFFHSGYEIRLYDKAALDATQQKRLLDDYNSYSGNIVSVFSKPIELFVAACVQVILLRFVSASMLRNEPSWKAVYGALALSASVGYLINNGFNALNAQLVDLEISSVIDTSDLSLDDTAIAASSDWTNRVSNVSWSVTENQPLNPITNTVLRNLVQSRAVRPKTMCSSGSGVVNLYDPIPLDTVDYGFPPREWMKQLLTEALPARSMRFLLNPTNKSANHHLASEDLPMSASIASNLVLYAVRLSSDFTPLQGSSVDPSFDPTNKDDKGLTDKISAAVRTGILPSDQSASDADQKKWFLNNTNKYLTTAFNKTANMTMANIPMTLSHVDVAPNIVFDAITFDIEVDPKLMSDVVDQTTGARKVYAGADSRYFDDTQSMNFTCGPWPARCVLKKRDPPIASVAFRGSVKLYYDAPAQIHAFSMCLNDNGTEVMEAEGGGRPSELTILDGCARPSTTSMLLLSVGKRLVADTLTQNETGKANDVSSASAMNVRKIYSFTVGRLSWKLMGIAEEFGAICNVSDGGNCQGLALTLNKTSRTSSSSQRLVVSADALPMAALLPPELNNNNPDHYWNRQRPLTLVQVNEPTRYSDAQDWYDTVAGDLLLPHNVRNLTWDLSRPNLDKMCTLVEERVQRVLDNHMYIEHPLQATYTAALFYLLQNGVVKDVVTPNQSRLTTTSKTVLLAFNGNTQKVALFLSTPSTNAFLTQLGCLFLLIGVALSIAWATIVRHSTSRPNWLEGITSAEAIARIKLDEKTFPPLLLHRHVTTRSDLPVDRQELQDLVIHLLSLQNRDADQAAAEDRTTDDAEDSSSVRLSVQV